jgi:hypothetical protein
MKTISVYSFAELSKDAKKKAVDNYRMIYGFSGNELGRYMDDKFADKLGTLTNEFGYNYSLSHSQGDGVCFYGKILGDDLYILANLIYGYNTPDNIVKAIKDEIINEVTFNKITINYCHKRTVEITVGYPVDYAAEFSDDDFNAIVDFQKAITSWYGKTCDDLEGYGYAVIDILQEDKHIADVLSYNDAECYLIDGTKVL